MRRFGGDLNQILWLDPSWVAHGSPGSSRIGDDPGLDAPMFADPHRVAQRWSEGCATRKGSERILPPNPGSRRPWATMCDPQGVERKSEGLNDCL
ncbi:MAG: hypothetical protein RL095_3091 [Verrucomicrobiota bacterium]|jgi:hypothetical protein